jgi:hypothetical protein
MINDQFVTNTQCHDSWITEICASEPVILNGQQSAICLTFSAIGEIRSWKINYSTLVFEGMQTIFESDFKLTAIARTYMVDDQVIFIFNRSSQVVYAVFNVNGSMVDMKMFQIDSPMPQIASSSRIISSNQ